MTQSKYPRIYRALKFVGFSPAKSLEVILDAIRGKKHAMFWIRTARRSYNLTELTRRQ
jgi:hypothetical protein